MKSNRKVLVALALMLGAIIWTAISVRSTSYSGASLNFEIGRGRVTVMNPSDEPIPAQLESITKHSFTVTSTIPNMPHSSTREGFGTNYMLAFELPTGESEFTMTRGSDVKFIAEADSVLKATVQVPYHDTKFKGLGIVIIVLLFFISYTTEHRLLYMLLGREADSKFHSGPYTGEGGHELRAYGDNRGKKMIEPSQKN